MDIHAARRAVDRLWGAARIVRIGLRADGGVDVELKPFRPSWDTDNGAGERDYTYSEHRLDAAGHAVCHDACIQLEARIDRAEGVIKP